MKAEREKVVELANKLMEIQKSEIQAFINDLQRTAALRQTGSAFLARSDRLSQKLSKIREFELPGLKMELIPQERNTETAN